MRLFLILLSLVTIVFTAKAQLTEMNAEHLRKVKVSSITIMGYALDEYGAPSKVGSKKEYSKYDTEGNQVKLISYDAQSAVLQNASFTYKNGVKSAMLVQDKNNKTLLTKNCEINKKGNYTSCETKEEHEGFVFHYVYDKNNNLIKTTKSKTPTGEAVFTFTYTYDDKNNMILEEYAGVKKVKTSFEYTNNLLTKKTVESNGRLSHSNEYVYNQHGDLTQEIKYNSRGLVDEQMRYAYFEKGKVKNIQKFNRINQLQMTWKYTYDDKWNIDAIKMYEGEKSTPLYMTQYLYKYYEAKK